MEPGAKAGNLRKESKKTSIHIMKFLEEILTVTIWPEFQLRVISRFIWKATYVSGARSKLVLFMQMQNLAQT